MRRLLPKTEFARKLDPPSRPKGRRRKRFRASHLPYRPFFYSIRQVAEMFGTTTNTVKNWCHFRGVTVGSWNRDRLFMINLAPQDAKPEWFCDERELQRYMKRRGVIIYNPHHHRIRREEPNHDD